MTNEQFIKQLALSELSAEEIADRIRLQRVKFERARLEKLVSARNTAISALKDYFTLIFPGLTFSKEDYAFFEDQLKKIEAENGLSNMPKDAEDPNKILLDNFFEFVESLQ